MKLHITIYFFIFLLLFQHSSFLQGDEDTAPWMATSTLIKGGIPFIQNIGQWNEEILYLANINKGEILFESDGFTYHFQQGPITHPFQQVSYMGMNPDTSVLHHIVKTKFLHSTLSAEVIPSHIEPYYHNYFIGNDPQQWASKVPVFKKLSYEDLYPGIDMHIFGVEQQLKIEYHVESGISPSQIEIAFLGADSMYLSEGTLHLKTQIGVLKESPPFAYQYIQDRKVVVPCEYHLDGEVLTYLFPKGYNQTLPLIIDPTLTFSTHTASMADNWGFTATFDNAGNAYAGGVVYKDGPTATDLTFPTTPGAFQTTYKGGLTDMTITKFNPTGTQMIYSTYIGGVLNDQPHSLIVNENNELWIFGRTNSEDFPVTNNAFQAALAGGYDICVIKLAADGTSLIGSTFIGGSEDDGVNGNTSFSSSTKLKYNYGDDARGEIIINQADEAYIASCTFSNNFPVTGSAFQQQIRGEQEACVFKVSSDLSRLIWASYLGGAGDDAAYGLKLSENQHIYITGGSSSPTMAFPSRPISQGSGPPGLSNTFMGGMSDGFVAEVEEDGSALIAGNFLGTADYDQSFLIDTDRFGNVYLSGQTLGNFPVVNPATGAVYVDQNAPQFIVKLTPALNEILYATTFGTPNALKINISPTAFLVDICENVYVTGWGGKTNSGFGDAGNVNNMPLSADAIQRQTDGSDLYTIVFSKDAQDVLYGSYLGGIDTNPDSGTGEHVDGGTSRFDKNGVVYHSVCAGCLTTPSFPTTPGAFGPERLGDNCNLAIFRMDFDLAGIEAAFSAFDSLSQLIPEGEGGCAPYTVTFENASENGDVDFTNYIWDFGDGSDQSDEESPAHTYTSPGLYEVQMIMIDSTSCNISDTVFRQIQIYGIPEVDAGEDQLICEGASVALNAQAVGTFSWAPAEGLSNASIPNPVASPLSSTVYTVSVENENGCVAQDEVEVNVRGSLSLEIGTNMQICESSSATINVSGPPNTSYQWSPAVLLDDASVPNPTITNLLESTLFTVMATAENGCTIMDSVFVEVVDPPVTNVDEEGSVCQNGRVSLRATGGNRYLWSTGDEGDVLNVSPTEATIYTVQSFLGECEGSIASILIEPEDLIPRADFSLDTLGAYAPFTTQFINNSENATQFRWIISPLNIELEGRTPNFTFPKADDYQIQLIAATEFGCADTFSRFLEVDNVRLFIPNAFSPNGDEVNSHFVIGYQGMSAVSVKIFSRWGIEIFSSNNPENPWDGTYNGVEVPEGVYVYLVEALGENNVIYRRNGTVTVIR